MGTWHLQSGNETILRPKRSSELGFTATMILESNGLFSTLGRTESMGDCKGVLFDRRGEEEELLYTIADDVSWNAGVR
jgi:hypothetical protein